MFGNILKGITSNPGGFLANSLDPANIMGHSGSNILANFANPGGGTKILPNYLTPNNMPTDPSNQIAGAGGMGGTPLPGMGSGIPAGQLPGLTSAFNSYLTAIGQPAMAPSFLTGTPLMPPSTGGATGSGMSPATMNQLQQLMQSMRGEQRLPFVSPRMGPQPQMR